MNLSCGSRKKGFTLIELLVVISIISLLSSVVLASLDDARSKARDAKRIQDITQIGNAFELYYAEHDYYPDDTAQGLWEQTCANTTINQLTLETNNIITENFLAQWPCDPSNQLNVVNSHVFSAPVLFYSYGYFIDTDPDDTGYNFCTHCQAYCIFANLESGVKFAKGNSKTCIEIRNGNYN